MCVYLPATLEVSSTIFRSFRHGEGNFKPLKSPPRLELKDDSNTFN